MQETIPQSDCWRSDCPLMLLWHDWWSQYLVVIKKTKQNRNFTTRILFNILGVCLNTVWRCDPPAAKPSNIRFFRSTGWLLVLMSTPAWAFLKMSFSSNKPEDRKQSIPKTDHKMFVMALLTQGYIQASFLWLKTLLCSDVYASKLFWSQLLNIWRFRL